MLGTPLIFQKGETGIMPAEFRQRATRACPVALGLATLGLAALGFGTAALAQGQPNGIDASTFRTTGQSRDCIDASSVGNIIPGGEHSLVFNTTGNIWLRNDVGDSCQLLKEDQLPNWQKGFYLHSRDAQKYCATDRFTVIDNSTIVWLGQCTLGKFTPVAVP